MDKDEALKMALEALESLQGGCTDSDDGTVEAITVWCPEVIDAIREALAQPEQEPVMDGLPLVIAGAIFDFAGYLTTRDKVIKVGSTANASPMVDLIKEWAALRGLSLKDPAILSWQECLYTTSPQPKENNNG